ncbi:DUF2474 domain-containing protein [Phaeovulum sp.]
MRRWLWFLALYLAGVGVVGMIAYLIRVVLM